MNPAEKDDTSKIYLRFLGMILIAMGAMYAITYLNTFHYSHVDWSETRMYMTLLMGSSMAVIMLFFMKGMYKNFRWNLGIVSLSAVVFLTALYLVRSQTFVGDLSYMKAMIPHHSIAILTSERANIKDQRVRELADVIIRTQVDEIKQMKRLIKDIELNGPTP
jgi:peptidoglycan/LPS O-acetylase OafA/YrhL